MFDAIFPKHWTTLQRLMWLKTNALARAVYEIVTGNPVSFSAKAAPLRQLKVAFSPKQDLHGYDAPWPAGGGKNKLGLTGRKIITTRAWSNTTPCDFSEPSVYVGITGNNYFGNSNISSYDITDTSVTVLSTSTGYGLGFTLDLIPENTYTFSFDNRTNGDAAIGYYDADGAFISFYNFDGLNTFTFTVPSGAVNQMLVFRPIQNAEKTFQHPQIELGSSATSYAPYSNLCPISGWSSLTVYHSGADTSNPQTISITLGSTVYSGTVDVVTGVVTVDWVSYSCTEVGGDWTIKSSGQSASGYWASVHKTNGAAGYGTTPTNGDDYGKNSVGPWRKGASTSIVGWRAYLDGGGGEILFVIAEQPTAVNTAEKVNALLATLSNPVQIAYKLKTPQTIQLTPQEVSSLLGVNNMWSDANGDLTVEYRSN